MAINNNNSNNDPVTVRVRNEDMAKLLTCSICNNIFNDPVSITECLDIFCNRCICKKIEEENLNNCPVCSVYLGSIPMDKLRPDYIWSSIRARIAPYLRQAVKVDDKLSSGEAEQSIPSPATRKKRRLSSLVNKRNIQGTYSFRRKRKANGRKAFTHQGSDSPFANPHKSVDEHLEGSRLTMNLNKSAHNNKQILHNFSAAESSKQQTSRKGRERTRKSDTPIELASNLLKPLTEGKNINYDKTATEGVECIKAKNIFKHEAKSSGKNLRSCDVSPSPIRKNRGRTKQTYETQGINFHAQTVADTASNIQHAKRVAPVWLSLVSSVNQEGEPLPQIPHCYTMIKDATLPISSIKKYLLQKLDLDSDDEVEISLGASPLPSNLKLHAVVDLWLKTMSNSEKISAKVGDSAENFVMVLSYGRKYPHRRN